MTKRHRLKQIQSFKDRLAAFAENMREKAAELRPGFEQEFAQARAASRHRVSSRRLGQLARLAAARVRDMQAHLDKLRGDAAECALIRDLSTDLEKRAVFTRLAEHLGTLADETEAAIVRQLIGVGSA